MIETNNLSKYYNGLKAVDGLNIKIEDGEIFGLLQHLPSPVVKPGHEILRLAQDGGTGGLGHHDAHLFGDGLEPFL